jgi:hypothetical protein
MSVDDWVQGRADVFLRRTLLLELVQRPAAADDGEVHDESAAAGTANSSLNYAASPAAAASDASLSSAAMQELQDATDNWLQMAALSLIFAPTAYIGAMSRQATHRCPATKQFWSQVTARMQLSDTQLRMLIAAQKEFNRLNQMASACIPDMLNKGACTALCLKNC